MNNKIYTYGKQTITAADIKAVVKVLKSDFLTQGPAVQAFEEAICAYTGASFAVAVANGTAALHLAALAAGVAEGVEAITSPITFVASSNCVLYCGGTVNFADIESDTACIDPLEIERQITDRTKVLIPVHFAGQPCDMEQIALIARKHNLTVIEDAAHAIGTSYKGSKTGDCTYSDMTIFSFHPVKTITTGEGGVITTNDEKLYKKLTLLRTHGITKDQTELTRNDGPWYYEMHLLGYNYRMSDIQAALGISQLQRLEEFVTRRREIVEMYHDQLTGDDRFGFLRERDGAVSAFHLCPLIINFNIVKKNKTLIFNELKEAGLHLQVHYIPVHMQPYYQNMGFRRGEYPRAEAYYDSAVSLPLYPLLKDSDIKRIVKIVRKVIR
ncbi:MAG: UDP-4-amino-4,6-dideoxy-N-acetyl-beta-L-altrosamine transaminase [Pelotomaculum sp. PtaB.Bin104]|nr:MAG: UDP-4-amino-4,6-dideoxy-N-acetyl-beta-L-altrosamine transaminase [Pelotomaculum sp. PtaB.Bin104]